MNEKWGRRLFHAGAVWLVVMGLVHSLSLFEKMAPANDAEKQLLDLMSSYHFNLMGSMRSMMELMRGFSVAFMLAAFGFAALDFAVMGERTKLLKRVALVNLAWLAIMFINGLHYFFAAPNTFLAVGIVIFALAWWKLPEQSAN